MSYRAQEGQWGTGWRTARGRSWSATKLRPPLGARADRFRASGLWSGCEAGRGRRLTLVACPAGFGKTTLLAAWREAEAARKPVAWLTLDEGDNDPAVLWSYVIEALRRACPAVGRPASPQTAGVASIVDTVLPHLVNELDDLGEVTLILDDFHQLGTARPARASPGSSITHRPPSSLCSQPGPSRTFRWPRCAPTATCSSCAPTICGSRPRRRTHS